MHGIVSSIGLRYGTWVSNFLCTISLLTGAVTMKVDIHYCATKETNKTVAELTKKNS